MSRRRKGSVSRDPREAGADAESAPDARLRSLLWCAAFASGFVITGIEIALGRLLAPHFGSSLVVWAAIMASVIGALSVGYPLGGMLADRRPGPRLPLLALLTGGTTGALLGIALPLWLHDALAGVGLSGAAYWGRLSLALGLFAAPCVLLACVPPAILRVTLRSATTAGSDAGWLYALGSLGSVLGILLPALWWIPLLGLRSTFALLALIAVTPSLTGLAMLGGRRAWRPAAATAVGLLPLALLPNTVGIAAQSGVEILHDADSGLQHIRVIAQDTPEHRRRWLQLNEGWSVHSALLEPQLATGDVWDWMAVSALSPQPDDGQLDIAIIGLAGGTVSNLITRWLAPVLAPLAIWGVELDPEVIAVADSHLGLDRSALRTIAADGRIWLRGSTQRFDLIVLDAYRQPSIPAHLSTREFFENVRAHLAPDGLAVLNVFAPAGRSRLLDGLGATWSSVFDTPQIFAGPARNGLASHLLFSRPVTGHDRLPLARAEGPLGWARDQVQVRTHDYAAPESVAAWTDDRAPVELLTDQAFRTLRPANAAP